ncbi:MAG: HTTM domain-containing protein [Planctomycetaceae bacterium]
MSVSQAGTDMHPQAESTRTGFLDRWFSTWFEPVPIHGLVLFRVVLGVLIAYLIVDKYIGLKLLEEYYIRPGFNFNYYGFSWVKPLPGNGMYYVFWGMFAAALGVAAGFCYRFSAFALWLTWTYIFLCEKAVYQNHHYLVLLLTFWMIFIPAHKLFSIDVLFRKNLRSTTAPAWSLWTIRLLIAIPYVYGSFAKMNPDWLTAQPVWVWMNRGGIATMMPDSFKTIPVAYFISYYGLLFDLLVVPALFWGRTRLLACVCILAFHLTNTMIFRIGIFPPLMISATLLFFPKDFIPNALAAWRKEKKFDWSILWRTEHITVPDSVVAAPFRPSQKLLIFALILFFGFQFLFPFRHFLYAGNPAWNGRGDIFAWRMMLDDKIGQVMFELRDFKQMRVMQVRTLDPNKPLHLNKVQQFSMLRLPDMILQYAHFIEDGYVKSQGGKVTPEDVKVFAVVGISLNARPYKLLLNPEVDLTEVQRTLMESNDWVFPTEEASEAYLKESGYQLFNMGQEEEKK